MDNPSPDATPQPETTPAPSKPGAEARIGELTYKFRTAERENESLKQKLTDLEGKVESLSSSPSEPLVAPNLEDFDDVSKFNTANSDYAEKLAEKKAREVLAEDKEIRSKERQSKEGVEAQAAFERTLGDIVSEGVKIDAEFQYKAGVLPLSDETLALMAEFGSADAAKMLHHLTQNPESVAELASSNRAQQSIRLAQLQTRISQEKPSVTNAPAPPSDESGAPDDTVLRTVDTETDTAKWIELRNKERNFK